MRNQNELNARTHDSEMNGTSSSGPSSSNQRLRRSSLGQGSNPVDESGLLNEQILLLVFKSIQWDLKSLCSIAAVNRKLCAMAKRVLWRELCEFRAPKMLETLTEGHALSRVNGGWNALAKLLFLCCGCQSTTHFQLTRPTPGHLTEETRFSKTSGRSFLTKRCREDLVYVSDPCEHPIESEDLDLGIYRGVFKGFNKSKTIGFLIRRGVGFVERVRCPYCGARVWSMTSARLIPNNAWRRLGSHDGGLEYFVCVNGHLYGSCWLVPLSSDEDGLDGGDDDEDDLDGGDGVNEGGYEVDPRFGMGSSNGIRKSRFGKDGQDGGSSAGGVGEFTETA